MSKNIKWVDSTPKPKAKRKDFAERLAIKLEQAKMGYVETGSLSDLSGRWVNLRVGQLCLNFSFDMKGELIDRIGIYKDVWRKVDEEQLILFKPKEEKPTP